MSSGEGEETRKEKTRVEERRREGRESRETEEVRRGEEENKRGDSENRKKGKSVPREERLDTSSRETFKRNKKDMNAVSGWKRREFKRRR